MEKQIVLQPQFSNGNELYVKVSVLLDHKSAFTALCNPDGKVSVQKFPTYAEINIYGVRRNCAYTGENEIMANWIFMEEDTRQRVMRCVNELPRSFQRLCMACTFAQSDMIEVHNYLRDLKTMFGSLQENAANTYVVVDVTDATNSPNAGLAEWRRADVGAMSTDVAQSMLDSFAANPEKTIVFNGNTYRAHNGAIEMRVSSDAEIAQAKADEYAKQRKTVYMAMFKPGQAIGEFEEGNLYACQQGGDYANVDAGNGNWRHIKANRLNFYNVYTDAPEGAFEAPAMPLF